MHRSSINYTANQNSLEDTYTHVVLAYLSKMKTVLSLLLLVSSHTTVLPLVFSPIRISKVLSSLSSIEMMTMTLNNNQEDNDKKNITNEIETLIAITQKSNK